MHRDANLRKRNALVLPGALLVAVAVVGMVYLGVRGDDNTCADGRLVEFGYACRDGLLLLAAPLVLGVLLVALGALAFRSTSTCRLGAGTWAWTGLVLLGLLVVGPWLAAMATYVGQDPAAPTSYDVAGTLFRLDRLLALAGLLGALAFVPYLALFVSYHRGHRCCRDAACYEPCFCDEPSPGEPVAGWAPADAEPEPEQDPAAPMLPSDALKPWEADRPAAPAPAWSPTPEPVPAARPRRSSSAASPERKTRKVRKSPAKKPAGRKS